MGEEYGLSGFLFYRSCQIPPVKPTACFCEPLKAVDFGAA
jgi:hypothetical protein